MTDPEQPVLRLGDPAHARLLRQMGARGLHEPLLATLDGDDPALGGDGAGADVTLVCCAGRALRALLPGNPKPVAALTRAPETVALLLHTLDADGAEYTHAREHLAASVLFSLALSSALHVDATLIGPRTLQHSATRRGLALGAGQTLRLTAGEVWLDGRQLDPWGQELGSYVTRCGPYAALRGELDRLPAADTLEAAERHLTAFHLGHAAIRELFDALEPTPSHPGHPGSASPGPGGAVVPLFTLPLAVGRARLPHSAEPITLARALLREGVLHRLTLLRLVDPLVHQERTLHQLAALADGWACAQLGLPRVESLATVATAALGGLTPLGERVASELRVSG